MNGWTPTTAQAYLIAAVLTAALLVATVAGIGNVRHNVERDRSTETNLITHPNKENRP